MHTLEGYSEGSAVATKKVSASESLNSEGTRTNITCELHNGTNDCG